MHNRSTIRPQVFHRVKCRRRSNVVSFVARTCVAVLLTVLLAGISALAQTPSPGPTYRVFLKTGQGLPSYGQPAEVGDHVIFNLVIRQDADRPSLQLVSLPSASIDLERTARYTETMGAAYYASTRGEVDYQAMTGEIATALEELSKTTDPARRLVLAEAAQKRLLDWSESSYHYREDDVDELAGLLDLVINELRAAAGQSSFSLSLVARAPAPVRETLLPAPTIEESVALAISAAEAADNNDERLAILAATGAVVADDSRVAEYRNQVMRRIEEERRTAAQYASLQSEVTRRAAAAAGRKDVKALESLAAELFERDLELGQKRPTEVRALSDELQAKLEAVRAQRASIEHYNAVRRDLLAYERLVRPSLSGLDGLLPVLRYIRDIHEMSFDRVVNAEARLGRLLGLAESVPPPEDLQSVHATIISALTMAREAASRRRLADISARQQAQREASSAAAGAIMLYEQGRQDLVRGLYPPKPQ